MAKKATAKKKPDRFSVHAAIMGRPRDYETPEALALEIDNYFRYIKGEYIDKEIAAINGKTGEPITDAATGAPKMITVREWVRPPEPVTQTGMALFLGFKSRQSLYDYERRLTDEHRDDFAYVIGYARTLVEMDYEKRLDATSVHGAIFALKNMGWKDRSEVDMNNQVNLTWNETKTYKP